MAELPSDSSARSRHRIGVRFSLRTFLLLVTLACCWLGWHISGARTQRAAAEAIREHGGSVRYSYQIGEDFKFDPIAQSWAPSWALDLVGHDFFHPVVDVNFAYRENAGKQENNRNWSPAPLDRVGQLPKLRSLYLIRGQANDENLVHVAKLKRLERLLMLAAHDVTDAGVTQLGSLGRLTSIHLSRAKITDQSLATFSGMPQLESLHLQHNRITEAGVIQLKSLKHLRSLDIGGLERKPSTVTDASLEFLFNYPKFDYLGIANTKVTDQFVARLKARFPTCSVYGQLINAMPANQQGSVRGIDTPNH